MRVPPERAGCTCHLAEPVRVGFPSEVHRNEDDFRRDVLRLCAATLLAMGTLALEKEIGADLRAHLHAAEEALSTAGSTGTDVAPVAVKRVRHILVEAADGPIAAIPADSAARILGDGVGQLLPRLVRSRVRWEHLP
jgi:hypothetical protein